MKFKKKISTIFDIKDGLSKCDSATFRWTIFEIPQPNWFTNNVFFIICQQPILNFKSILQPLKKAFFHSTGGEKAFNLDAVISFGYLYGEADAVTGKIPEGEKFKKIKNNLKNIFFNIFSKNFRTSALPNICHVNFPRLPCGNQYFDRLSFHRGKIKPEMGLFQLLPS